MKLSVRILLLISVCLTSWWVSASFAASASGVDVEITAIDPQQASTLAFEDNLYVKLKYASDQSLRFCTIAMRDGAPLEFGVVSNPGALYSSGQGEALAWLSYTNPTHIDAVKVIIYNSGWKKVAEVVGETDVTWQKDADSTQRELAAWVGPMLKKDRRKTDLTYDPTPKQYGMLRDAFFLANLVALPLYLLWQLQMLVKYRYRWRELAMLPLVPFLIAGFYALFGLIETGTLVSFVFRYTLFALLWLCILWLAKRVWQHKLPPPKLYRQPKD